MDGEKNSETKSLMTRRKFLIGTGALIATGGIIGCSSDKGTAGTSANATPASTGEAGSTPALPWSYKKLNVDDVRKRGYEGYFKFGCCYGAAEALLLTLKETSGGSWGTIPMEMFKYGAGGAYSWGTLCGALNGALAVIAVASEKHAEIGNELIGWYTKFPFPSDKHEAYCKVPKQNTTVSDSPLCHVSVSKWAVANGAKINEAMKKDRCAKVTGDTAAKAAELLNQALDGAIVAAYQVPAEFSHCMQCHQGASSMLDNEQGKMNCLSCHDDHTGKITGPPASVKGLK